MRDMDTKVCW